MKFASALPALAIAGFLMAHPVFAAQSYPMIEIAMDRAKVMRISRPAAMVIIGNPAIADATIKDSQTLIITGKQYGTTNLIVLDNEGEPIADEVLNVSTVEDGTVTVYKGTNRFTLNCSPNCQPTYRIGDQVDRLKDLAVEIQTHQQMSKGDEIDTGVE